MNRRQFIQLFGVTSTSLFLLKFVKTVVADPCQNCLPKLIYSSSNRSVSPTNVELKSFGVKRDIIQMLLDVFR